MYTTPKNISLVCLVTGRHSQGSPLPGCVYIRTYDVVLLEYIRAILFGLNIYSRCCCAKIYTCDVVLLECIIMCDAVLLEYIRAMLGLATSGSGDPWEWRPQTV